MLCAFAALAFGVLELRAPSSADSPLVAFVVVDGAIAQPLTGEPGDPERGAHVAADRKLGNCLSCHQMPIAGEADQGNLGPDLHGVGSRYTAGQLRLRIVNATAINPATIMPGYYRVAGLNQVAAAFAGKPILSAQQVEDVVAYLGSLK